MSADHIHHLCWPEWESEGLESEEGIESDLDSETEVDEDIEGGSNR